MFTQDKLISVIIPIYKVENYLNRCVNSVVKQTYKNLEIILVDDGSPDNCPKLCDDWAKKDNRIRVIHKENGGLSDARNAGIDIATGRYICFVDSDDFIHSGYVEILFKNIEKEKADLAICSFEKVYGNAKVEESLDNKVTKVEGDDIFKALLTGNNVDFVVAWSKLYKKELFNNLRFDVGRLHEDEFIVHKILLKCKKVVYTSAKLYYYQQRQDSIMGAEEFTSRNLDAFYAIEQRYNYFKDTKWQQVAIEQLLGEIENLYYIAKKRGADKQILKFLKQQFNFYFKQNKNKKLSQWLFKFCPKLYYFLKKIKNPSCYKQ